MNSPLRVPFRALAFAALTFVALPSFAVIATTTNSTPEDTAYNLIGKFTDSSGLLGGGVVVGDHLILTARHVVNAGNFATSSFVLGGVTYHPTGAILPPNYTLPDGTVTKVDVALISVSETFSSHYLLGAAPTVGSTITMVGYGLGGGVASSSSATGSTVSAAANTYYAPTAAGTRHAGNNTIDDFAAYGGNIGPVMESYLDTAGEAVLGDKDSGGGWFQNGRLVGISSYVFNDTVPDGTDPAYYTDRGFASANTNGYNSSLSPHYTGTPYSIGAGESYYGSGAIDLTNPQIDGWLRQNGVVPEPASMLALGLGAAAMVRRKGVRK